ASLAASRKDANTNDSAYVELRELQREAETTRSVYESFLSRVKEMNEAERVYTPDARIISPASIPQRPSSPKKTLTLALALLAGLMAGSGLALMRDLRQQRPSYSETELLTFPGLRPLISIPALRSKSGAFKTAKRGDGERPNLYEIAHEVLEGSENSRYRGAIFQLLSYVMDLQTAKEPRIVTLTSASPKEGKTALALSLAVAAASSGTKTLLVDASESNPMLTQMLGQGEAGASYRDQVVSDVQLRLSFLSLHDETKRDLRQPVRTDELQALARDYGLTVIDGGLLKGDANAAPLVSISEAVLLVSQSSEASPKTIESAAADLLEMARGRYCASVLTMANA
ncbi:MAG: GNVR domain-containing protein, partial [Pseudomonadota bacterium]